MELGEFLFGTRSKIQQIPLYNPQQQQALQSLLGIALQGLQGLQPLPQASELASGFEPFAQQARQQFAQQTVPSLAERFTSMGGRRGSGVFTQALGQAGAGLESSLATGAGQYGLQQQQLGLQERNLQQNLLQNLLSLGLSPQTQPLYQTRQPGFLESLGTSTAQGLGSLLPGLLSTSFNPMGGFAQSLAKLLGAVGR